MSTATLTDDAPPITPAEPVERPESALRAPLVEALGTFFLTLTVGCAVLTRSPFAPLGIAAVLAAMIFAGGHVSGAHFNPAVSLAALVRGRLTGGDLVRYWVAQLAGGVLGGLLAVWVTHAHPRQPASLDLAAGTVVELLFTFALCWVVLNVATSRNHPDNNFYGIAIGLTVLAGAVAAGGISGGEFNPAVDAALAATGMLGAVPALVFAGAQLTGGVLAGLLFRAVHRNDR